MPDVDWSQFKPIAAPAAPPGGVDWSQFKPVAAAPAPAVEQAPLGNPMGDDVSTIAAAGQGPETVLDRAAAVPASGPFDFRAASAVANAQDEFLARDRSQRQAAAAKQAQADAEYEALPLGEKVSRAAKNIGNTGLGAAYKTSEAVALGAGWTVDGIQKTLGLPFGPDQPGLQQPFYKMAEAANATAAALRTQPEDQSRGTAGTLEKVAGGLLAMAPDLAMMYMTKGASAGLEGELAMARGGMDAVKTSLAESSRAAIAPSITQGINRAKDVLEQGGTADQAFNAGLAHTLTSIGTMGLPMAAPGARLGSRVLSGAATGAVQGEAMHAIDNAAAPQGMQTELSNEDRVVSALTGGILGGGMAHPKAAPLDARSSIEPGAGAKLMADAINGNVRGTEFLRGPIDEFAARSLSPEFANPRFVIPGTEQRAGGAAPEAPTLPAAHIDANVDASAILNAPDPVKAAMESLPEVKVEPTAGTPAPVLPEALTRNLDTSVKLGGRDITTFGTDELQALQSQLTPEDATHGKIAAELGRRVPAAPDAVTDNAARVADTNTAFAEHGADLSPEARESFPKPDLKPADPAVVAHIDPVIKAVSEVLGVDPVAVAHSPTLPDGVHAIGRSVVNVDGLTKPAAFVVVHESLHNLQSLAREGERLGAKATPDQAAAMRIWGSMERALWQMVPQKARDTYAAKVMKLTPEQAADPANQARLKDEMLADFGAKRLSNRADLEELAKHEPKLFGEFANRMIDWISKVIDSLKGKRGLGAHDIDKHIADLNSAKMMWRDALVAWKKRGGAEAPAVAREMQPAKPAKPAKEAEAAYSPRTPEEQQRSEAAMKKIGAIRDLFQFPKGQGKKLEQVAKSIDPRAQVRVLSSDGRFERYRLTLPPHIEIDEATGQKVMVPGGDVGIRVRKSFKGELHPDGYYGYSSYDADPATAFAERPGANAEALGHKADVILDASLLNSGDNGSLAYAIASDFAKNNGHVFIGDPSGLSDKALVRRTEQMLSSALKHGTTDHIAPHPRQLVGDEKLGVPPLHWDYADPVGNIERMIEVSRQNSDNYHPAKFDFDPATGDFHDDGFSFDRAGISSWAAGNRGRGGAGSRTLARAAVLRAALRGSGEEGGGAGGRDGVLEKLLHVAGEHAADRQALNKVFYSPRTEEAAPEHDETTYGLGPKSMAAKNWLRERPSVVAEMVDKALDASGVYNAVAPMSSGTKEARAVAQKYINEERAATYQWTKMQAELMKRFTPEQREAMFNAADEQNTLLTRGEDTKGRGIDSLPADQRLVMDKLHDYGEKLWKMAQDAGLVKPDNQGVAYWTPRMMAIVDEAGNTSEAKAPGKKGTSSGDGRNITTTASSIKARKYETAAETEAAMAAKGGKLVRDIATMPLAMMRLEKAIAGRQLINTIKEIGLISGKELVSGSAKEGFFTLDHPAFRTFKPELRQGADGKWSVSTREDGTPVMESVPLFISNDFKGPLKAIMSGQAGPMYRAFMLLKSKAMSAIMFSPLIHNMVIAGRAFAYAGVKLPALYFRGALARRDGAMMDLAIRHGLVPISGANHTMLDVGDVARGIGKEGGWGDPNESWASLGAKAVGNKVRAGWGDAAKAGLDRFGNFWHGTLLWDRVGDLQAGIFQDAFQKLQAKGLSEPVAATLASHYANRYAGAVGKENMSNAARKWLNVLLFSRSFNVGNVGAVKDVLYGLPEGLRAQVSSLATSEKEASDAIGMAKRKAFSGLVLDLAAAVIATSVYQDWKKRDKEKSIMDQLSEAGAGYKQRAAEMVEGIKAHPFNPRSYNPYELSSTRDNEPGKEDRIDLGAQENSARHEYQRLPTGKVVEDTIGWTTHPTDTALKKLSPVVKSVLGVAMNNQAVGSGFEKPVWDPSGTLTQKAVDIAKYLVGSELPIDQIKTGVKIAQGNATQLDKDKFAGNFTGLSVSQGHPMGPEGKVAQQVEDRLKASKGYVLEAVKSDVDAGKIDEAIQRLVDVGFTQREALKAVGRIQNPSMGVTKDVMKRFFQHANEDERAVMERVQK